ncbi:hypothetical protein FB451DRAFT_1259895 [Mycena latifolia]|nr:hypothetical protein FB451DRAFT_1259895 [Mycena latifolia]
MLTRKLVALCLPLAINSVTQWLNIVCAICTYRAPALISLRETFVKHTEFGAGSVSGLNHMHCLRKQSKMVQVKRRTFNH